jgi:phosphonopyruvate decarboxylase
MLKCEDLWGVFKDNGLNFFTGVPDSTFKDWMSFLADNAGKELENIIAANEGEAVAIATGHHLATGNVGVVYMQNSGVGNTVNPITSLADPEVYGIPMLLMVGWRGEPGKKDEPQHRKMGRVMMPVLDAMEVPYVELPSDIEAAAGVIAHAKAEALRIGMPHALIVKKGTFEKYAAQKKVSQDYEMVREDAIKTVIDGLSPEAVVVSTTGKASREVFEHREATGGGHQNDFLTVGSMGYSSAIALSVALAKPKRQVYVFDGDGAAIMHAGSLATIGHYKPKNLCHIVFNNEAYGSTGGQPTTATTVDFANAAIANGYVGADVVDTKAQLMDAMTARSGNDGPYMLIVNVKKGARSDLGRPTTTPQENKSAFMDLLKSD